MDGANYIRKRGLKATPSRIKILDKLSERHEAYSHAELENIFCGIDRVTLYRVLNDFEQVGLVHKLNDREGVTRFALCNHDCPETNHAERHVHFNCENCHKMFCIEKVYEPNLKMPVGFNTKGSTTIFFGLCKNCNAA